MTTTIKSSSLYQAAWIVHVVTVLIAAIIYLSANKFKFDAGFFLLTVIMSYTGSLIIAFLFRETMYTGRAIIHYEDGKDNYLLRLFVFITSTMFYIAVISRYLYPLLHK